MMNSCLSWQAISRSLVFVAFAPDMLVQGFLAPGFQLRSSIPVPKQSFWNATQYYTHTAAVTQRNEVISRNYAKQYNMENFHDYYIFCGTYSYVLLHDISSKRTWYSFHVAEKRWRHVTELKLLADR